MDRIFHEWRRMPWDWRALGIATLYMLIGGLWIPFTDWLAAGFAQGNQQVLTQISIYKGWVYVLVTGLLLYWLVQTNNRSLHAINRNYVLLAENISDVIWTLDLDTGRFTYISPSIQHLRGMSPEEALRESPQQALLPESWQHISSALPGRIEEFKGGVSRNYMDVLAQPRKDGSVVWVETASRFVVNEENGHMEVYAASRDVTERRQAEGVLRETQTMLNLAEEVAGVGSWRWDLTTQKVTWSEQMFRLFAVEPEGFDGDVNRVIAERIHPDDAAAVQEANRKVLEKSSPAPMTYRILLPDGAERIVWAQGRLVMDEQGVPRALVGYVQDITERVRTERKILQMQRLYATLSQVNQTIVRVRDPLELYRSICHVAVKFGEFSLAWVGLLDEASGDILPVAATGLDVDHWPFPVIKTSEEKFTNHLASLAIRTSSLQTSEDVQTDSRMATMWPFLRQYRFHASAVVPLTHGGRTVGVLSIISSEIGFFKAREEQLLLEEMGMDISFALNNIEHEKIKRQWADAFEHCAHGIAIGLPSGRILTCNPAFASRQGYTIAEITSRLIVEMYAPQDREQVRDWITEADRSGHVQYEAHMVRKDGRVYPVQMDVVSVRDEAGNLLYRVATQQDITARKRAEQLQQEMELRFSKIFQASPVAINIFWLADGRSLDANDAYLELTGYSREEVLRRTATELDLFVDVAAHTDWMENIQNGLRITNQDARIRRKDGEIRDVLASLDRIEINREPMVLVFATDITERKRAEEALRDSEEKFKYIFDHSPIGKSLTTLDGHLSVNQTFADMLGYSLEELQDRTWQELTYPDDIELNQRALEPVFAGEKETARLIKRYLHKNGSIVWVDLSTSLRRDSNGQPHYFISEMVNVTERRQAENALRESERQLRALVTSLDDIVFELDERGAYRNIWAADENLLLRPRIQLLGQSMPEILGGEIGRLFEEAIPRVLSSGIPESIEYPLEIKGSEHWLLARINPIKFDSEAPHTVSLLVRDITDRKVSEEARRASEARFATVFNASPMAIAITGIRDNRLMDVNPAWQTVTGWSRDEVIGHSPDKFNLWADPSEREHMVKIMLDKGMVQGFEMRNRKKTGEIVNLLMSVELITVAGERCMLSVAQDITARKQAEERAQLQLRRLQALNEIDRAINASLDIRLSLDILLTEVLSELGVDAASILLLDPLSQALEYVAGKGFRTSLIKSSRMRIGEGLAGQVGLERKTFHFTSPQGIENHVKRLELFREEQFVDYYGIPLVSKGVLKGVLEVFHRAPLSPDPDWVKFLETLGEQAAIAVDNSQLFENIQKSNLELISAYDATIMGWSRALDLRDKETEGHSQRVTEMTLRLAQMVGMSDADLQHIRRGALLHDIGKLGVPDHILYKPGRFTEEEWQIMKRHPTFAYEMLSPIDYLRPAIDIPYCHHEKWDGTGYPRGLKQEQIPLAARLFAIVDVWDALRSDRPYRPSWSSEQARAYIREQSGQHFDPQVVEAFLEMLEEA